jgi:hypothetical protein
MADFGDAFRCIQAALVQGGLDGLDALLDSGSGAKREFLFRDVHGAVFMLACRASTELQEQDDAPFFKYRA